LEKGTLKLNAIKTIIMDEADRMLDMGFLDDIKMILSKTPDTRQTVLFSATIPKPIAGLIKTFTVNPTWVKIESQTMTVPAIEQIWYEVHGRTKIEVLCRLIDMEDIRFALIFCATKIMVDELVEHLIARGYMADKLHGDMSQMMRERVMERFRRRSVEFLVATDVAARGLDVKDIEVVFNYDLPNDGEDYVHRIGRTGRAGSEGKAITFVSGREVYKLQNIMRFTKGKIRRERVPSLEQVEERRANISFDLLRSTLEGGAYKRYDNHTDRLLDQGYSPTDIISALMHLREKETSKASDQEIPIIEKSHYDMDKPPRSKSGPRKKGGGKRFFGDKKGRSSGKPSYPGDFPKRKKKKKGG